MRFTTAERMAKIDRTTVEDHRIDETALMETAGQLTARHARNQFLRNSASPRVVVLPGKGHNGADGLVSARWLAKWGYPVVVLAPDPGEEHSELTRQQAVAVERHPDIEWRRYEPGNTLPPAGLYLDALLGTGLAGDPRPPYDELIERLNARSSPVVSVDVPSGLSGDCNVPFDPCVRADLTVTFGLPKLGMVLEPGYTTTGQLVVQELGFPEQAYNEHAGPFHLISPHDVHSFRPVRHLTDHKGDSGRLTVVAGSDQYPGAAYLTARSASTAGAGLTSLIGPAGISYRQGADERELVFPMTLEELWASDQTIQESSAFLDAQDAFVLGPGLGQSGETREGLKRLIPELSGPVVLDADGLNNFSSHPEEFTACDEAILTPHPGEAARLLDEPIKTIQKNPLECLRELVDTTGQTVILKTSRPLIGHPDGSVSVNATGTPALAKGGSGDVLTGMLGGFLAQGIAPGPASCLSVYLLGACARSAESSRTAASVRAPDLVDALPTAMQGLENGTVPDWYPVKFESLSPDVLQWTPFPE